MRYLAALATIALAILLAARASAETFSLGIVDLVGCVDPQQLIEQVTARAKGAVFLASGARRSFALRLEQRAGKIVAELKIESTEDAPVTRVVDGASCREVASAIALIMALALEPRGHSASSQPEPDGAILPTPQDRVTAPPVPPREVPANAPPVPSREGRAQAATTPERRTLGRPAATARRSEAEEQEDWREPTTVASPRGRAWRIGIGAEVKWTTLFTSQGMWLLGLRGEGDKAQRFFVVIQATLGPKAVRDAGNGSTDAFSFYGVGAALGTPVVGTRHIATDAMMVGAVGGLHFVGVQRGPTTNPRDATATWIGVGPGLRLRWFNDAGSLAFETMAPVNLIRPHFTLAAADGSQLVLYQTPPAGIFFGLCGTWNMEPSTRGK